MHVREVQSFVVEKTGPAIEVPSAEFVTKEQLETAVDKAKNRVIRPGAGDAFPLTTNECGEALGMPRQTLKQWIDEGVFKQGVCWIQRTPTRTAARWWNVDACRVALQNWNKANAVETYEEVQA